MDCAKMYYNWWSLKSVSGRKKLRVGTMQNARPWAFLEDCNGLGVSESKTRDTKQSSRSMQCQSETKDPSPRHTDSDAMTSWLVLGDEMMEIIWPFPGGSFKSYCVMPPTLLLSPVNRPTHTRCELLVQPGSQNKEMNNGVSDDSWQACMWPMTHECGFVT